MAHLRRGTQVDRLSVMRATAPPSPESVDRMRLALVELDASHPGARLADDNVEAELRVWLDEGDDPIAWARADRVTEDEWFFITTLYGEMTLDGQRSHIRRFYPSLFIRAAGRDVRNFMPGMPEYKGLRSAWMSARLCRMAEILKDRGLSMAEYTSDLRRYELIASPENPMPALDTIVRDHRASGWKTLSVFVRDCVRGNCFPIDSRVEKELRRRGLPVDERALVGMCLEVDRNPREVARMFFEAGGTPV